MNEKVLIIDDLPFNIRLLKEILEDEGYKVHQISENIDINAIETICGIMPSAILLDIMMPKISGYKLCRKIKEHPLIQSIPVIMLSAMSDNDSINKAIESGAFSFICKPYSDTRIITCVKSAIDSTRYQASDFDILNGKTEEGGVQEQVDFDAETIFDKLSGDMEFFKETACSFEDSSLKLMANIRESIIKADEKEFRQGTHALKSLVLYFNANKALAVLMKLEKCSVHENSELINELYSDLEKELEYIICSLKKFIIDRRL